MRENSRRTGRWLGLAAVAGVLLSGGCGTTGKVAGRYKLASVGTDAKYGFTVTFDGNNCPIDVEAVAKNCPGGPKRCVYGHNGETLVFVADREFFVQFDPFKKGSFKPVEVLKLDVFFEPGVVEKKFPFNVLADPDALVDKSKPCPGIDPEVIVRP